mmetsp:Transcript_12868/g.23181  ORF Transcript_12868/g.23181 Transcript_12868/m.23181 type:complete len:92 (-) Transcript_12868:217-492(-)|eukprot:CAMPEP_0203746852 /NCGR_PEP_ID=MMETSP0098-20131031/2177_1 /ASSEMBLY_ACC=CAM_ASM_000208 /TAXON_ID=96639 /ORGANISM=" , Strain NY0313808BC1" /LENGTH=91 /DNA_ID=CAMNT_0050635103 /DNA_START=46 /DNA_END=321 /DNA_ORIENTATION=-
MDPGGLTPVQEADADVQQIVDQVRGQLEQQIGVVMAMCTATLFRTQVVNGIIYYVKVHAGGDFFLHLSIFEGDGLANFQIGHTANDPIEPF